MVQIKTLKLIIDITNTDDGIKQLLGEIKPTWEWNNVDRQIMTGGYSCVMMRCFEKSNPEDSVTIRIRNVFTMLDKDQQNFEIKVLKHLCDIGYFPDLLATFDNGYCYQYIVGKPVINIRTGEASLTDSLFKSAAEKMVQLHVIKLPLTNMAQTDIFHKFVKMLKSCNYKPSNPRCPTKEVLIQECAVLETMIEKLNSEIVLCHGDAHPGNIVWNEETENVTFVDWEFSHVGYQYADIAHFVGIAGSVWEKNIDGVSSDLQLERIPKDMAEKFCRYYYKEWCKINGKLFTEQAYQKFKSNVDKFKAYDAFQILLFSTMIPEDKNVDFIADLSKFTENNTGIYLQLKEKHFGKKTFG